MPVGILRSGLMGGKLGTLFARAGHEVVFSFSRSQKKLERLAREAGGTARAGTPREAARDADVLLLAVHWSCVDDVLQQAGDVSGKVIMSCSLPMNADDTELVVAHTSSGAEELARKAPGVRVVSAFGTVPSEVLFGVFNARGGDTQPSLLYCGDDAAVWPRGVPRAGTDDRQLRGWRHRANSPRRAAAWRGARDRRAAQPRAPHVPARRCRWRPRRLSALRIW